MKRFAVAVGGCALLLVCLNAHASPEKAAPAPGRELPSPARGSADTASSLSGKVVEAMNAGGYTYVCIEKNGKKTWAAVPEMQVTVGESLTLQPGAEMTNFTSKSLNRTFASIIFSAGAVSKNSGAPGKAMEKHPGAPAAAVQPGEKISVEKAAGPNAYTVGEIFAQRTKLNKKSATVKAKVVKVSAGIMGKNWIHLQDGSGDAAKGTNNLVATSQDLPKVGDIVTIKGTITKDKDFGAGYKYSAIMEEATLQR